MADSRDTAGVLVFPPYLFGAAMVLGFLLDRAHPMPMMPRLAARAVGVLLFVTGIALASAAQAAMRRVGTNVRPDQPTTAIAVDGPFRYSRNPIYVAGLIVTLGVAVFANALAGVVLLLPVALVLHYGVVKREERYLEAKFGDVYRAYRSRVRRWL